MTAIDQTIPTAGRFVTIGSVRYPVLLPKLRDPRLHLAAVVFSLQILGQTVLGFDLSIAQILVSLGTAAFVEFVLAFWHDRTIAWPASALLSGNGIALLLRVPGTEHGQWWSLHGAHIYAAIAALAIFSKYVFRVGGRPLFNPANFALTVGLLILGSQRADPQDLWWGPLSVPIVLTLLVICAGAIFVTARNGLFGVAAGFFVTLAAGAGVLAFVGHCITARWHIGPICGTSYWWILVSSPEILVFTFFMVTDPKTIPESPKARVLHGVLVGVFATLAIAPQTTEFATKVAILAALVVTCALRPLLDRWFPAARVAAVQRGLRTWLPSTPLVGIAAASLTLNFLGGTLVLDRLADDSRTAAVVVPSLDAAGADVPQGSVPKVAIDESATRIEPAPTQDQAQKIGSEVVAAKLAQSDKYTFDTMRLLLITDPANPQAAPQFSIQATGKGPVDGGEVRTFKRLFLLGQSNGHYVIQAERDLA